MGQRDHFRAFADHAGQQATQIANGRWGASWDGHLPRSRRAEWPMQPPFAIRRCPTGNATAMHPTTSGICHCKFPIGFPCNYIACGGCIFLHSNGRGRADGPVHIVRFSRHVLLVPRSSSRTIPNAPMPPPKPRRAAFRGFFFLGPAPTAEQRLALILPSAPRKNAVGMSV